MDQTNGQGSCVGGTAVAERGCGDTGRASSRDQVSVDRCASANHAIWLSQRDRSYSPFNKPWDQLTYDARRQVSRQVVTTLCIAEVPFNDEYESFIPGVVNFVKPEGGRVDAPPGSEDLDSIRQQAKAWEQVHAVFNKWCGINYVRPGETGCSAVCRWMEELAQKYLGEERKRSQCGCLQCQVEATLAKAGLTGRVVMLGGPIRLS